MAKVKFHFPFRGKNTNYATGTQEPFTSPVLNNVRAYDVLENRARGGQRPGLQKQYSALMGLVTWDISSKCIAYWKLDDDDAQDVVDEENGDHNGTGSVITSTFSAAGKVGTAFNFNGDRYVTVADDPALSFGADGTDSPFSIAAWIYVTAQSGIQIIISKSDMTTATPLMEWQFYLTAEERLAVDLFTSDGTAQIGKRSIDALSTNAWHFVLFTYDGSKTTDGIKLYTADKLLSDADDINIGDYFSVGMSNTAAAVLIGAREDAAGSINEHFEDKLDNIMIFDEEITAAEELAIYSDGDGISDLTTVAGLGMPVVAMSQVTTTVEA